MANYPFTNYSQMPYGQYQQPFTAQNQPFANYGQNGIQPQNVQSASTMPQAPTIQRPLGLVGRMVTTEQEITANEVPGDGSVGYFPSADGSVVYAKAWNGSGSIDTVIYERKTVEQPAEPEPNPYDIVIERLEAIEAAIADLKPKPARTRKAADSE